MLFRAQDDLNVAGELSDVSDLPRVLKDVLPELVILDLDGPGILLEDVLMLVRRSDTAPLIFGLSVRATDRTVCMDAGADGFAYKGDPPDRLLDAIRSTKTCHEVK
jgi:DNA-binding NarL/FixJ family response regulator